MMMIRMVRLRNIVDEYAVRLALLMVTLRSMDAKYGKKVCGIECAGKCDPHHHCTVTEICTLSGKVEKRYLYGNTVTDFTRVGEDDGAHLKGVSACMQCEKKGDKTHCKEVKCKDGDDEDDDEEE